MIHLICPNPAIDRTLLTNGFFKATPNRPYEVKEFAGGKSFNVAYAMNFDTPTPDFIVHTILGGRNGDYLKQLAKEANVSLSPLEIKENTRLCNIIVDTDQGEIYPIYENSFNLDIELLEQFTQSLEKQIKPNDTVVFSGSLMKGMPEDYIKQFQIKFKDKNVKFFIDTSGAALKNAYSVQPEVIKINDEEILDLVPDAQFTSVNDYAEFLKGDIAKQIPFFIITLGAKGVIAKMKNEIYFLSLDKIVAKNPIASGDFFLGALVKFLTISNDYLFALKKAISYSTANCLNWYPELKNKEVNYFFENIKVEKIQ